MSIEKQFHLVAQEGSGTVCLRARLCVQMHRAWLIPVCDEKDTLNRLDIVVESFAHALGARVPPGIGGEFEYFEVVEVDACLHNNAITAVHSMRFHRDSLEVTAWFGRSSPTSARWLDTRYTWEHIDRSVNTNTTLSGRIEAGNAGSRIVAGHDNRRDVRLVGDAPHALIAQHIPADGQEEYLPDYRLMGLAKGLLQRDGGTHIMDAQEMTIETEGASYRFVFRKAVGPELSEAGGPADSP